MDARGLRAQFILGPESVFFLSPPGYLLMRENDDGEGSTADGCRRRSDSVEIYATPDSSDERFVFARK
jgi:hypothetical protein